jgi:hypothetical protein
MTSRASSSAAPSADTSTGQPATLPAPEDIKRINVAVNPDIVRAIQTVMTHEHVNLTEAVRRLIGYGDFVYRAIKENNEDVLLRSGDKTREVVLLR